MWICEFEYLHNRGEECGHNLYHGMQKRQSTPKDFIPYQHSERWEELQSQIKQLKEGESYE